MDITVTQGSTELASGDLEVDTSTTPPTGTFTPTDGYEVTAQVSSWSASPNGAANWSFQVSGSANGDFPLGPNGNPFRYNFTGNQNAQGSNPSGNVTWPPGIEAGDPVVWQGEATEGGDEDEGYSRTQSAG
ncbi:MAG TPA: hypothetical protein VGP85_07370 [Pyrinomonadaceae bacterium]|jgi:hypothetical protein|nr:hypothetical protein [Pyrinomonadaceae bacterium]